MGRITDDVKDQIRDRIRPSQIASRHITLKRAGREMRGLSPFTNEKTPSFYCADHKGFYHCFSSGKSGDVISLTMELENMPFVQAVEWLADMAGVEIPEDTPQAKQAESFREKLHKVMEQAQHHFIANLSSDAGLKAREYLEGRGITDDEVKKWGIGYSLPSPGAIPSAIKADPNLLLKVGLTKEHPRGNFGFFRDRIMFPTRDRRGRIVSYGARALNSEAKAKYLNSPASPIFDKSKVLYGLDKAANRIRKAKDANGLILAEGYLDIIAFARAGLDYAVAPMGTAITEGHLQMLWRHGPEPIICLDGDAAGTRAFRKFAIMALGMIEAGQSVRVARLPSGLDPFDLLQKYGEERVQTAIHGAVPMHRALWELERDSANLKTPEGRAEFSNSLKNHLNLIKDKSLSAHYRTAWREWTRDVFRNSHRQQGRSLEKSAISSHRGLGILIRCIDSPKILSQCDESIAMVKWEGVALDIFNEVWRALLDKQDINRDLIIDGLLAQMKNEAVSVISNHPIQNPMEPNSDAWKETLNAIQSLQSREEVKPKSLLEAIEMRKAKSN